MMKQLSRLHEEFIDKARRPMTFGKLPVLPTAPDVPVVAVEKWKKSKDNGDEKISKKFRFMGTESRNEFLKGILDHESEVGHHVQMNVKQSEVVVILSTHGIDKVTELDKEFAKHIDDLYRDAIYNPGETGGR